MEKWFCIWDDLANPKNRFNLVPKPTVVTERLGDIIIKPVQNQNKTYV